MKDLFVITGSIEDLKDYALKLDRELMKSAGDSDVDFDELEGIAEDMQQSLEQLLDELI
ncbi:hypothetical protein [Halobacillus karajensis]|uniref:Uncharacterized protein n=1 Tax=Halobacillus karajensis TaxID=195088 RepID=A0A059NYN4_9BACI|nr:hypothetical protein [Halobacillus karajensis]CDQ22602.1 hypothetical protein BN983_00815 [Halobacillus karajensis]CDQ26084.1 hypothetical protein BN981_00295 [Halobacillus karajensis]